ncbi:MAG: S9 family peptidase [Planctomycetales bacterium]|nr:S9 family peptidase [bacterium]UNM06879.1 MAG: S9 family peptidase [Planctomycetales bacterium]
MTDNGTQNVPLIPLEKLIGNPAITSIRISPDGRHTSWIAPVNGVLNIWLSIDGAEAKPVTDDRLRGIQHHGWARNSRQLLYIKDQDGDENWNIFAINIDNGETRQLTDQSGAEHAVAANFAGSSRRRPDEVVVGLNIRDESTHDLYLLNTLTGERSLLQESRPQIHSWHLDRDLTVRGYTISESDGGKSVHMRAGGEGEFSEILRWGHQDALSSGLHGFSADNNSVYLIDSSGRNSGALCLLNLQSGERTDLFSDPDDKYDVDNLMLHPQDYTPQAASVYRDRAYWTALDDSVAGDIAKLAAHQPGDFFVESRSDDDRVWIVAYIFDNRSTAYHRYNRDSGEISYICSVRPELDKQPLVPMKPISFRARDGREIHGYLTLPEGASGPLPLVLNVHGGPWTRDSWRCHPEAQWLANRGYACLQVNYRGSTGYGKDHINAGDRQWGRKMQDDLTDAVKWAIAEGIADEQRVAIYGGSYGGYATLAGLTFTPELYCCGAELVGPSNMETFLNSIPPYWESFRRVMDRRVGVIPRNADGTLKDKADYSEEDRAELEFIRSISPFNYVDRIRVPLLIAQGANDPRVKRPESEQIVDSMREKGLEVEYVCYEDEGHGFARPQNRLDWYHRADRFLAKQLGGRCEDSTGSGAAG